MLKIFSHRWARMNTDFAGAAVRMGTRRAWTKTITDYRLLINAAELQAIGCWLLAVSCWLLAVSFWLLAVGS